MTKKKIILLVLGAFILIVLGVLIGISNLGNRINPAIQSLEKQIEQINSSSSPKTPETINQVVGKIISIKDGSIHITNQSAVIGATQTEFEVRVTPETEMIGQRNKSQEQYRQEMAAFANASHTDPSAVPMPVEEVPISLNDLRVGDTIRVSGDGVPKTATEIDAARIQRLPESNGGVMAPAA